MQVVLKPIDIAPQLPHLLIFDPKEFKPKNNNSKNKRGIKTKSINTLPRKLIKKLNPKIGIYRSITKE